MNAWEKLRKSDFPITRRCVYLDHASAGPIPLPVKARINEYYEEHVREADSGWPRWIRRREEIRASVARMIGADPSEIAFTQSTSHGMNLIADMIASEGAVLTNTSEFPSSTVPWLWRRAKVVWQKPEHHQIELPAMRRHLTPRVRTVVTSLVQYATGFRQDLAGLAKIKGRRYLVVNASQGFGALDIDVRKWDIDFLCTNSYKWLLAGYGGGVLYVKKKWLRQFRPRSVGWRSMARPEAMNNRGLDVADAASRYEMGCPAFGVIYGVGAAAEYLSAIGIARIEKRILELTDFAIQGLERAGFEVVTPRERNLRGGIVVFKVENAPRLWKRLLAEGIYVSVRGEGLRLAPHFYNTFGDIEIFFKKMVRLASVKGRK